MVNGFSSPFAGAYCVIKYAASPSPRGYFRPRRNFNIAPFLRHFQATAGCKSLSQQTVARRIRLFAGKLFVGQPKPVESALQKGYNIYVMDSSFARNLTRLRKAAGLTPEQLAEKLFVTRQAVSKWERDESSPDIDTVVAIAELFSVTTDQLLKGEVPTDSEINVAEIADGEGFRSSQRRKLARSMVIFALFECAALCLATGVLFTSLIGIAEHIWLVLLTLPVLAPLIFGIRFYGVFGAAWFSYFVYVPVVCLIIFEVTVLFVPEVFGAWLCFLFIPLYYAAAVMWTVVLLMRRKAQGAK